MNQTVFNINSSDSLNTTVLPELFFKFDAMERQSEIYQRKMSVRGEKIALNMQKKHKAFPGNLRRPIVQPRKF